MRINSVLLCALLPFAFPSRGLAQAVSVGLTAGIGINTLTGSDVQDAQARTVAYVGGELVAQAPRSIIGFQTGVSFVGKGATFRSGSGRGTLKVSYFDIPAMLRFSIPVQGSSVRPTLLTGAAIGIRASCKVQGASGNVSLTVDCGDSAFGGEFDLKALDLGVTIGAGVDVPMGKRYLLSPAVRYTRGLTDIGNTSNNANAKNSSFQIGAGIRFR